MIRESDEAQKMCLIYGTEEERLKLKPVLMSNIQLEIQNCNRLLEDSGLRNREVCF